MSKILLLFGPSGVGKSTIIRELCKLDDRFIYPSPYVTRPLREGEQDKIFISNKEMDRRAKKGEFLVINEIYGVRYATPKKPFVDGLTIGMFPVIDWPIRTACLWQAWFPNQWWGIYLWPPSLPELKRRLNIDSRDVSGLRFKEARKEVELLEAGNYDEWINDDLMTDAQDEVGFRRLAQIVRDKFLKEV
jgi:guanylate kinase